MPGADDPLRVVLVGAGFMGQAWLDAVDAEPSTRLAGVVDLDLPAARAAAERTGTPGLPTGTDLLEVARAADAQAVIDVTVPAAHHPVTTQALFAGLPVLGEKPAAATVAEALSLAAAAEVTEQLFMVSQSRRYNPHVAALRAHARGLGSIGSVSTQFLRAPHFGGFREEMDHPLLVDMAIHPFDTVRHLLAAEPVAVYCESHNPAYSWYRGDASATAVFELTGGTRYTYAGSWCAPGEGTSPNGAWWISGERGTVRWDGESAPVAHRTEGGAVPAATGPGPEPEGVAGALAAFARALRTGATPHGEVHENLPSLLMVESAVEAATGRRRVPVDEVLERARDRAVADEQHPDVARVLRSWSSAAEAFGLHRR